MFVNHRERSRCPSGPCTAELGPDPASAGCETLRRSSFERHGAGKAQGSRMPRMLLALYSMEIRYEMVRV